MYAAANSRRAGFTRLAILISTILSAGAASAQEAGTSLEEIVVTGRFISETGRSALKLDVPLRDVPLTISGYTGDFMASIETTRIADLYSYMSGVRKSGATGYDISIRGFSSSGNDRNAIQTDGMPGLTVRFGSPPTINAARVEVVKGPAAVLYGQIQPGGFVNIVTKKPESSPSTLIKLRTEGFYGDEASMGDTAGATVSFDSTGPIDEQGKFLYRMIAEYGDRNTFRDNGFAESVYLVPSLTWNISDRTQATVFAEYRDEDNALDNGLAAFGNDIRTVASLTTRYQEPDDEQPETGYVGGLTLDHAFNDNLRWRLNYRYVWHEDSALGYENLSFRNATTLRRRDRNQENERTYNFIDTSLGWDFELGSVRNKVLLGLNGGKETAQFTRLNFDGNNATLDVDLYDPVYGQGIPNADRNVGDNDRKRKFDSWAVYLQDQLTLTDHWKAVAALRYESYDTSEDFYQPAVPEPVYVSTQKVSDSDMTSMFGIIYQPNDVWSLYASYAESFNPPTWGREDADGQAITAPEQGSQIEFGVKSDFDWGTATLSFFTITREDVAQDTGTDQPDGTAIWALTGKEKSEGAELEVNASISDNWQLIFAYSYVDAKVDADANPLRVGQTLSGAPENTASIWNRYQFNDAWGVGLGIGFTDSAYGTPVAANGNQSSRMLLPSYTLVDVGIYYTAETWDASLRAGNVFDETYYLSGGSLGQSTIISPGTPANLVLSLTKRF